MNPITVTLPYPISANRYWRTRVNGQMAMTYVSKEAKEFKTDVGWRLRAAGVRKPFEGRVSIHIDIYPHRPQDWQTRVRKLGASWDDTVQCLDIDNARKVLYDALKGIAIEDDKWIWTDSARRCEPDGEARVVMTITPIAVEQPQAEMFA